MHIRLTLLLLIAFPIHCLAAPPGFMKERMGSVSGVVMIDGETPMHGGIVSFFDASSGPPPSLTGVRRIPVAVAGVDRSGKFSTELVPGMYYIGALVITEPGRGPGPPRPGEKFYLAVDDKGKFRQFTVFTKETIEFGKVTMILPDRVVDSDSFFTIEGKIADTSGKPFSEAVILVKTDPRSFRPAFATTEVNENGTYLVKLPAGTYYLMARQVEGKSIVGRPTSGSFIGVYGASGTKGPAPGSPGPPGGIQPPSGLENVFMETATGISPNFSGNTPVAAPLTGKAGDHLKDVNITVSPIQRPGVIKADNYFTVEGKVTDKQGKPLSGMQVHAKQDLSDFRPDLTSGATDEKGRFTLRLPAGVSYFLLARQASMGPPESGIMVGIHGVTSPVKELLVFLMPGTPGYDELLRQAKPVNGKPDETVKDILISVGPLGGI